MPLHLLRRKEAPRRAASDAKRAHVGHRHRPAHWLLDLLRRERITGGRGGRVRAELHDLAGPCLHTAPLAVGEDMAGTPDREAVSAGLGVGGPAAGVLWGADRVGSA